MQYATVVAGLGGIASLVSAIPNLSATDMHPRFVDSMLAVSTHFDTPAPGQIPPSLGRFSIGPSDNSLARRGQGMSNRQKRKPKTSNLNTLDPPRSLAQTAAYASKENSGPLRFANGFIHMESIADFINKQMPPQPWETPQLYAWNVLQAYVLRRSQGPMPLVRKYVLLKPSIRRNFMKWEHYEHYETMQGYTERLITSYMQSLQAVFDDPPSEKLIMPAGSDHRLEYLLTQDLQARQFPGETGQGYAKRLVQRYFLRYLDIPESDFVPEFANAGLETSTPLRDGEDPRKYAERLIQEFTRRYKARQEFAPFDPLRPHQIPKEAEYFFLHKRQKENNLQYITRVVKTHFSRRPAVYTIFYPFLFEDKNFKHFVRSQPQERDETLLAYAERLTQRCAEYIKWVQKFPLAENGESNWDFPSWDHAPGAAILTGRILHIDGLD